MTDDPNLLAEYVQTGSDATFRELVACYVDLVYSTALRLVGRDAHRAEDVAQTVFINLARVARTLPKDVKLGGWLHRDTCFTASTLMRGERRRQSRERQVVEMNALQNDSGVDYSLVAPVLDEAINQLGEADRIAILLRFFERQDFRSVGQALRSNEDAARMRVTRALEKLEALLKRQGITTTATSLGIVLSANAVQAAPVGLALTISTAAALTGTTLAAAATVTATKAIAMTTLQKTIITATVAVLAGAGIYEARQASQLRAQVQTLQEQQTPLAGQIQQLQREREEAANRQGSFADELARAESNNIELLKLRSEVARLRGNTAQPVKDPAFGDYKSLLVRASKLKQRLTESPEVKIPEFRFLSEDDYLEATRFRPLDTEEAYLAALSNLRSKAEFKFITTLLNPALTQYAQANNGQFPTELAQLQPYFASPVEDAILERWEIAPAKSVRTDNFGDPIITTKAAVDEDFDPRYAVGLKGFASAGRDTAGHNGWGVVSPNLILGPAYKAAAEAYLAANNGQQPTDRSQILPYLNLTTPEQQAAFQKLTKWNQKK